MVSKFKSILKKHLWLFSLLISAAGLVGCSSNTKNIRAFYCDINPSSYGWRLKKIYEGKFERFAWFFNEKTGQLYDYDYSKNVFFPLVKEEDEISTSYMTWTSKIEGNILEVEQKIFNEDPSYSSEKLIENVFLIDIELQKESNYNKKNKWNKYNYDCIELPLPEGAKVR